ncbi:hypothetical protein H6F86_10620 [Phormidium sp. FACHB-592]|uniref:hypothetical protein n=1 Tax=Cyanophyceae TaxID=3028117 RepID=UPI0016889BAF|nr:hypothetical protein [Phormidium sp. FACHB-592]MBD2074330.1 hypothetical protein [Phormidium sp. FACHB-592]
MSDRAAPTGISAYSLPVGAARSLAILTVLVKPGLMGEDSHELRSRPLPSCRLNPQIGQNFSIQRDPQLF